jgi:hypothetical protein
MLASITATAVAAALALSAAPADLTAGNTTPAQTSTADASVAPNWWGGFVGDYFEHFIADFPVPEGTVFELAPGAILPPGLELASNGVVHGVPTVDIVQITEIVSTDPDGVIEHHWAVFNIAWPVVGEPGYDFPEYPDDPDDGARR